MQELRNVILQLAIEGKLVEQNHRDEPIEELLCRINVEIVNLTSTGTMKKPKSSLPINETDIPFSIPKNWKWVRLGDLSKLITDGTHKTPKYVETGIPFLSVKNISRGYLDKTNTKYITKSEHLEISKRCLPERGDILFCRIGTLGKALLLRDDFEFSIFVSLGLVKLYSECNGEYLELLMNSPEFYRQIEQVKVGGSHTNKINLSDVPNFIVPLPPVEEQKRIVDKVNELFKLIDGMLVRLENKVEITKQLGTI
jgi:type I restriction enzyme S subunit